MRLLRDKKSLTKFLLLYKMATDEPTRLIELADSLDMSEQAVSNYVSTMEEENLINTGGKRYKPTHKGMDFIEEIFSKLGDFLESASKTIDVISTCAAIAGEPIRKNDKVGLFMRDGFLHASNKKTSSIGIALNDADTGEPLLVGYLQGITEMDVGCIFLISVAQKNEVEEITRDLKQKLDSIEYDILTVEEEWTLGLANMIDADANIKFAPISASLRAAEKGLDVAFILTENSLERTISTISRWNSGCAEKYHINYKIV